MSRNRKGRGDPKKREEEERKHFCLDVVKGLSPFNTGGTSRWRESSVATCNGERGKRVKGPQESTYEPRKYCQTLGKSVDTPMSPSFNKENKKEAPPGF